ncbi:MAG TPA: sigma-70 family RNA polymerase sigma factor [Acidimicrobiales bacterium]|jgi:RNA polymerase sigma-70 factor (ECF subfamily)|nr:sigma-70 family RNA polymerase sigma factor [Acidimicrobiales bacterium]
MTAPPLDELAARARSGEPGAFDDLVRATSADSYALAFRLTGNETDASDVVQEAYIRAFRGIDRFRSDASVRTWLYRIVANSASNVRRARPAPTLEIEQAFDLADARADRDPGLVAERREERAAVVEALRNLPFALRAVVVLRDIYDLSHEAIADELGISRAAARVRLHRARKLLRDAVDPSTERAPRAAPSLVTPIRRRSAPVAARGGDRARAV